ncbi:MAG: NAD-dependent epimerase/dehydratase family protein [Anaerolineae bacterium]|nr:NAD-dependent epimerase/dehydratase family protein [Anaerolineae bacterium]
MTKKVLITGAGGFIGSHLWRYLDYHHYLVIPCVTTKPNRPHPANGQIYSFRLPDQQLGSIIKQEKPDWLVHCAGGASVPKSLSSPNQDFRDNVVATESLFDAVAKNSPETKVIFISSAAVYGNSSELPIREDTLPNPISPYGFHKLMGELISQKYYRLFGIPTTILRIFSVYGPGLKKQLLWDIYQKWLTSEIISLYGTGEESRDFIYIDDLGKVIHQVMIKSDFKATILNVATGREITIRQLANLMVDKLGEKKQIHFTRQTKSGDPDRWQADITRLNRLAQINWLAIETGISNYAHWLHRIGEGK